MRVLGQKHSDKTSILTFFKVYSPYIKSGRRRREQDGQALNGPHNKSNIKTAGSPTQEHYHFVYERLRELFPTWLRDLATYGMLLCGALYRRAGNLIQRFLILPGSKLHRSYPEHSLCCYFLIYFSLF